MPRFLARTILLCFLAPFMADEIPCWAQAPANPALTQNAFSTEPAPKRADSASDTAPRSSMQIEDELEAMRKRIDELEAELKKSRAHDTGESSASTATNANSANTSESSSSAINSGLASTATAIIPASNVSLASTLAANASAGERAAKPKIEPFSDADWTWLNGNPRTKEIFWDSKFFTPEIRADVNYVADFNHPADHTIGGSSELFRSYEVQLEQLGIGGDFHYDNVRARFMTQLGIYSVTTPRNDPSVGHGQWDLARCLPLPFRSLWWVSLRCAEWRQRRCRDLSCPTSDYSATTTSTTGLINRRTYPRTRHGFSRASASRCSPPPHLKFEPWFINGWQSYASANHRPGIGGQIKWTPKPWLNIISNNYGLGADDLVHSQSQANSHRQQRRGEILRSPG